MNSTDLSPAQNPLYRWLWRWHGYAGLFVVPFVFFMALTGIPYVWEQELEDLWHPELRAIPVEPTRVPYEEQLAAARAALPGHPLMKVRLDNQQGHATQFVFSKQGDPVSVFVHPYQGRVIRQIREWDRLSFAAISLHGLSFAKPYGSWLQEILACWGILLCLTGVWLWWPRGGGSRLWGVFLPRLRAGRRTRWRDIHAVGGFYIAAVLALYLVTGLPWTSFWGGKLLRPMLNAAGQPYPALMMPFLPSSGLKSAPPAPGAKPLPLDAFVAFATSQNLAGQVEIKLPGSADGTVHLYNDLHRTPEERHFHLDQYTRQVVGAAGWEAVPPAQKAVALGIDLHEGQLFGRAHQIGATVLSGVFMLVTGAGAVMWWRRRPGGQLDTPKPVPLPATGLPLLVKTALLVTGLLMPLLGLCYVLAGLWRLAGKQPPPAPTAV